MKKRFIISPAIALFIFLILITSHSQQIFEQYLSRNSFNGRLKSLRAAFGKDKTIPKEIEIECLAALSYYPELKNTKIIFKFGSPLSTMVSRPKLKSVLRSGYQREYEVIIRKPGTSKNGLEWSELSFN